MHSESHSFTHRLQPASGAAGPCGIGRPGLGDPQGKSHATGASGHIQAAEARAMEERPGAPSTGSGGQESTEVTGPTMTMISTFRKKAAGRQAPLLSASATPHGRGRTSRIRGRNYVADANCSLLRGRRVPRGLGGLHFCLSNTRGAFGRVAAVADRISGRLVRVKRGAASSKTVPGRGGPTDPHGGVFGRGAHE